MFSLRDFILTGLRNAVGKMADYQVILNAAGWQQKGVLLEEDLAVLDDAIKCKNMADDSLEPHTFCGA